jgi:hypothetical protein
MFGQDDNSNNQNTDLTNAPTTPDGGASFIVGQPALANPASPDPLASGDLSQLNVVPPVPPGSPIPAQELNKDVISPAGGFPSSPNTRINYDAQAQAFPEPAFNIAAQPPPVAPPVTLVASLPDQVSDEELIGIKKKALSELIPIIDSLDQPPLDKFRTIMMMIQASDDERLIEKAYESAHAIEDKHAKAQALLDLVNEINYFTQPDNKENMASQPETETKPSLTEPLNI